MFRNQEHVFFTLSVPFFYNGKIIYIINTKQTERSKSRYNTSHRIVVQGVLKSRTKRNSIKHKEKKRKNTLNPNLQKKNSHRISDPKEPNQPRKERTKQAHHSQMATDILYYPAHKSLKVPAKKSCHILLIKGVATHKRSRIVQVASQKNTCTR